MYKINEQAPVPIPPVKQPMNYAIPLRWVLSHILLLSPGFIMFIWLITIGPTSPAALLALPLIIGGAFAAQGIGIIKVFQKLYQYILWMVAFGVGFAIMFVSLFFSGFVAGSKDLQTPWGIALVGGLVGLLEAFALRTSYKRAWWWIPANAAGLMLGVLATTQLSAPIRTLCGIASDTNRQCGYPPFVFPVVTGVALFSIITGATVVWISRREAATPAPIPRPDIREPAGAAGAFALVLLGSVLVTQFSFIPQQAAEQAIKSKAYTFLEDIDMVSPQEGWAVGTDSSGTYRPVMYHYTGGIWSEVDLPNSPYYSALNSVSMTSASEGWAVGDESTFLHYLNGTWTRALPPTIIGSDAYITSFKMLKPSDGWATTSDPLNPLLHYDGKKWEYAHLRIGNKQPTLTQLSFSTPDDGWAIGFYPNLAGATLHYTGGEWRNVDNPMAVVPNNVQALSPDDVWAVASGHTVGTTMFHYTDGKWSKSEFFPDLDLGTLIMISPNEGWAIGGVDKDGPRKAAMAHYDGTRWTRTPEGTPIPSIAHVSMISPTEGWAVGGSTFYHYQNGAWIPYTQP